jgi:hypothetical protein
MEGQLGYGFTLRELWLPEAGESKRGKGLGKVDQWVLSYSSMGARSSGMLLHCR